MTIKLCQFLTKLLPDSWKLDVQHPNIFAESEDNPLFTSHRSFLTSHVYLEMTTVSSS